MTDLYSATYVGLLEVHEEDGLYTLKMGLPSYMSPMTMSLETDSDTSFISFIQEELRTRNYTRIDKYSVVREDIKK